MMLCRDLPPHSLSDLMARFGLTVVELPEGAPIPGSYWGEPEAGIRDDHLYVRADTPVHSALHEGGHLICGRAAGRTGVETDAGGTFEEEDAVCYLQILLADRLPGMDRGRMMADMDAWGYTFRLGSTRAWFEGDADVARKWLQDHGVTS